MWHREVAEEWVVPHSCMVDKSQERYLRSEQSQPQARPHSPESQHRDDRSPSLLAVETSGGWGGRRNCRIFRRVYLKDWNRLKMYAIPRHSGTHHQGNSWKGTSHIWEVGEMTENGTSAGQTFRSQAMALSPLQALPPHKTIKL